MKRLGADSNRISHKRRISNKIHNDSRPHGMLTELELVEIRKAYADGAKGDLLIGMQGEERVLPQLLPPKPSKYDAEMLLKTSLGKLREIGCDKAIYIAQPGETMKVVKLRE